MNESRLNIDARKYKSKPPTKKKPAAGTDRDRIILYALISLISFLCGLLILILMLWHAKELVSLGLTGNLFYLVLLLFGLSCGAFLFGVLGSYASFRGRSFGGHLQMGGPIVAVALVVIGSFWLVPNPTTFSLTVFVHGKAGSQDTVLRNSGYVVLDLGPDRQREIISDKGQAYFPAIPSNFRRQVVPVTVESDTFEVVGDHYHRFDGSNIYVQVQKKSGRVVGRVQDKKGEPITTAEIHFSNFKATTDSSGRFEFVIPGDRLEPEIDITVIAPGYVTNHYTVTQNANPVIVLLNRQGE